MELNEKKTNQKTSTENYDAASVRIHIKILAEASETKT